MQAVVSLTLFLLSLLAIPASAHAQIKQISSFSEAKSHLDSLENNALVVFDVDAVLIDCVDPILQAPNNELLQTLIQKYSQGIPKKRMEELTSIVYLQAKRVVIEPEVINIINCLQSKNITVIGLTATKIGGIGHIDSIQQWRIDDLKECGITFTPFKHEVLEALSHMGPSPVFKDGILFSGGYPKGLVLRQALDTLGYKPDTILFFDDLMENVNSVERHMKVLGIANCHCFHYTGAKKLHLPADPISSDRQIAHLIQHGSWSQSPQ